MDINEYNYLYQQAIQFHNNLEYSKALDIYKHLAQTQLEILKREENPQRKSEIKQRVKTLLDYAEQCSRILNPDRVYEDQVQAQLRQIQNPQTQQQQAPRQGQQPRQESQTDALERMISNEIIDHAPGVRWSDIAGLENAKTILREAVILPTQYPELFTGLRAPPRKILLFGPPGTGKTLLAKALASECNCVFLNVTAATLTSKFFGEAEKLVRALFSVARKNQPAIIFIDEIDSLLSSRSEGQHDATRRLQNEFLIQMEGLANSAEESIIMIGATNRPQELDDAVLRRFTKRVLIDLPNYEARLTLILNLLTGNPSSIDDQEFQRIATSTEGYSGSDLANLCKEAAMIPLRNLSSEALSSRTLPPIGYEHFVQALRNVPRTVNQRSLAFYQKWNAEYGSQLQGNAYQHCKLNHVSHPSQNLVQDNPPVKNHNKSQMAAIQRSPTGVKDIPAAEFIAALAAYLKRTDKLRIPGWADYVKTGTNRELCPFDKDWLYVRTAAIARKVYLRPNLGVGSLRKIYGGPKNFGTTRHHNQLASGKVLRYCLHELDRLKLIEYDDMEKAKGKVGGRRITNLGMKELNSIARQLGGESS